MANYSSPFVFLPDEHMRLLGIIAAHWEYLDMTMQRAMAEVMRHKFARVALLTENISFRAKADILLSYAREGLATNQPDLWKEYGRLNKDVATAYGLRNKYVHARWKKGTAPSTPIRVVTRTQGGKFTLADEPTPAEEMAGAAQTIYETAERFMKFFQKFGLLQKP